MEMEKEGADASLGPYNWMGHPGRRYIIVVVVYSGVEACWVRMVCFFSLNFEVAQTVIAWFALILIASGPVSNILKKWAPSGTVSLASARYWNIFRHSWLRIPYLLRLSFGWLVVVGIFLSMVFGFRNDDESLGARAIPLSGIVVFQTTFFLASENRSRIQWPTVINGLILQQVIAMFVLKTRAGFDIFDWIVNVVIDFFGFTIAGKVFVWDEATASKEWLIINIIASVFLFLAFVELLYYIGVMEWILKKLAWFFFNIMNISGAEAVVAASSPIVGQGDAACLVKPYMNLMTRSELHLVLTSGYSTISGTFVAIYVSLGVPAQNLITSSCISIPAVIAISKMRCPEMEEPVTRGNVVVNRGEQANKPENVIHAFFKGAAFGLQIAAQIIANTLVFLSFLSLVNSLLTWIGLGFGIPRTELLPVARLLATKLVANELVAYTELQALMKTDAALSARAYTITTYALCGFANISSLAVTGVIAALAPSKATTAAKIAFSALLCGF
ncbi:hypothetical protein BT96DRAFT_994211 [Gymnopus androsaceus JB14]|uniref:H+/nucleoside cotransporter n=1 Tax=Gymnopus androsaceus JB14 TaxID=1447944 RepID=A0A6A4HMX2_9AGAR|nr:hypothetical protein BT96DRAFT_994211 [Gymnopus androsaceus JB14]